VYLVGADSTAWYLSGTLNHLSNTPILRISIGSDGAIFAIRSSDNALMRWDGSSWILIGGSITELAVRSISQVYVIGNNAVWVWNGSTFSLLSSQTVSKISVGSDGTLFAMRLSDSILLRWNGSSWVTYPGSVLDICVQSISSFYVIDDDSRIYSWNGSAFVLLSTQTVSKISMGSDGALFAVRLSDNHLIRWDGSSWIDGGSLPSRWFNDAISTGCTYSTGKVLVASGGYFYYHFRGPWPLIQNISLTSKINIISGSPIIEVSNDSMATWSMAVATVDIGNNISKLYYMEPSNHFSDIYVRFRCPTGASMEVEDVSFVALRRTTGTPTPLIAAGATRQIKISDGAGSTHSVTIEATFRERRRAI
jgi:hypothetical protein